MEFMERIVPDAVFSSHELEQKDRPLEIEHSSIILSHPSGITIIKSDAKNEPSLETLGIYTVLMLLCI